MRRFALLVLPLTACWADPGPVADARVTPALPTPTGPDGIGPPTGTPSIARVAPPFDVRSTAATVAAWPRLLPGVETRSFSSFDRAGGNDDGFSSGRWSLLYTDERNESVIFDAAGPGVLRTMWFTSGVGPFEDLKFGTLSFRFDGEERPRFKADVDALFRGEAGAPFVKPLVQDGKTSTGGRVSWVAMPFRGRLVVSAQRTPAFYAMHYETFPSNWDVKSWVPGDNDAALAARFEDKAPSSETLEEVALDVTKTGSGVVDVLRFEPNAIPTDAEARAARIRAWFDGATEPQIDAPLSAFFGSGLGPATVTSIAWTMKDRVWESRLPMPFWQKARFEIQGLAGKLKLHVAPQAYAPNEAGHLFARARRETFASTANDFVYLDEQGAGKIVGTVLTVLPESPTGSKRWWEGDLRTRVDGKRARSIHGTGHEDDHLGGWSNEFLSFPYSLGMQGCPRSDVTDAPPQGQVNANATMYRLWPGIPFLSRARHSTEHGYHPQPVTYEGVAFFYRAAPRLASSDAVDLADASAASAHGLVGTGADETVDSAFEGEATVETGKLVKATKTFDGPFSVTLAIEPMNQGVMLRRLYDAATRQVARVQVDGVEVGAYVQAETNPDLRWGERDFFLPPSVTRGKSKITVRFVPVGTKLAIARVETLSVGP